jgi:hypothetical protein
MRFMARQRLGASGVTLAVALALIGVASSQVDAQTADAGMLTGQIARCVNGAEQPAPQVSVGIEGGSSALVRTDSGGQFLLALPPGQYTVVATASDGTASRQYVPVQSGEAIDIGILDIGGGVSGCGPDSAITEPVLPTLVPTVEATPAPTVGPVPTVAPTPVPTPEPPADVPSDAPPEE